MIEIPWQKTDVGAADAGDGGKSFSVCMRAPN